MKNIYRVSDALYIITVMLMTSKTDVIFQNPLGQDTGFRLSTAPPVDETHCQHVNCIFLRNKYQFRFCLQLETDLDFKLDFD